MDTERLVTMVNDIAAFFGSAEERPAAAEKVANHLRLYWAPRMRAAIVAHQRSGGGGLDPVAADAVTVLASAAGWPRSVDGAA